MSTVILVAFWLILGSGVVTAQTQAAEIELTPGSAETAAPGETVVFTHAVTNIGSQEETITIIVTSSLGFAAYPNFSTQVLAAGETALLEITLMVPTTATIGLTDTLDVEAASGTPPVEVATASNTTNIVTGVDISLVTDQTADPGDTITYTHQVTNTSRTLRTFSLSSSSSAGFTTTVMPITLTLDSQASASVDLIVTVPLITPGQITDTTTLAATADGNNSITTSVVDITTINSVIVDVLLAPDRMDTAAPGDEVHYQHTVTNIGSAYDILSLAAMDTAGNAIPLSKTTVPLFAGESTGVLLTVTVPATATVGSTHVVTVTATTYRQPTAASSATDSTLVGPASAITPTYSVGSADPGTTAVYTHTVTNISLKQRDIDLNATSSAGFNSTVTPTTLILSPGASAIVTVSVPVPPGTPANTVDQTTLELTTTGFSITARDDTTVNAVYAVSMTPDQDTVAADPGQTVTYQHLVTNEGNAPDQFAVAASSSLGFPFALSTNTITLNAGGSGTLTVDVTVPPSALASVTDTLTVMLTSAANSQVQATAVDRTGVNFVAGLDVTPTENSALVDAGQTVTYQHLVTNLGNGRDRFTVSAVSSLGFSFLISTDTIELDADASLTLTLLVTVPPSATPDDTDILTVTLTSAGNSQVQAVAVNQTTVKLHVIYLPLFSRKEPQWESIGLATKLVTSIDACTTQSGVTALYAGTETYLARLNPASQAWETVSDIPSGSFVVGVVMDAACQNVYVSTAFNGTWQGDVATGSFQLLGSVADTDGGRAAAIADGVLFVARDDGIVYWDGTQWQQTGVTGSVAEPITHISAADPSNNTGPLYAVQWENPDVLYNATPAATPTSWALTSTLTGVSKPLMRAVFGDESRAHTLGIVDGHYAFVNNQWQLVRTTTLRAYVAENGRTFIGYEGGLGVYASRGGAPYTPFNRGWSPVPSTIRVLIIEDGILYAATSAGVWAARLR